MIKQGEIEALLGVMHFFRHSCLDFLELGKRTQAGRFDVAGAAT